MSPAETLIRVGGGFLAEDGRFISGGDPGPVVTEYRDPATWPFAATAWVNTSLGDGCTYGDSSHPYTTNFRGAATKGQLNWTTYCLSRWYAQASDPSWTITMLNSSGVATGEVLSIKGPANGKFSGEVYNPALNPDSWLVIVEPGRGVAHEFYKAIPTGTLTMTARRHIVYDLVNGDGFNPSPWSGTPSSHSGIRASKQSLSGGALAAAEVANTTVPARSRFRHALALAIPDNMLLNPGVDTATVGGAVTVKGARWPALSVDANAATAYSGQIPMGTGWGIPPSVDVTTLGLDYDGESLAWAAQDFGLWVVDRASIPALVAELGSDPTRCAALKAAWSTVIRPLIVPILNIGTTPGGPGLRRRDPAPPFAP